MRIGLALMTNRLDKCAMFALSLSQLKVAHDCEIVCGVCENGRGKGAGETIEQMAGIAVRSVFDDSVHCDGLFDTCAARRKAIELLEGCDYIMNVDDDFVFRDSKTKDYQSTSGQALMRAVHVLATEARIGMVQLYGHFGGNHSKDRIVLVKTMGVETALGLVYRQGEYELPCGVYGIGDDMIPAVACLAQGRGIARLFNVTTYKDRTKKKDCGDPNYASETLEEGMQAFLMQHYSIRWEWGKPWPESLMRRHRDRCRERCYNSVYDDL